MKVRAFLYVLLCSLVSSMAMAQQERDPFTPFLFDTPANAVEAPAEHTDSGSTVRPLNNEPLSTYRLIGLLVSPSQALAVVQTSQRREYFVTLGDELGKEGGVIDAITVDGIAVDIAGEIVNLKVTNKFEIQNEAE